MLELALSGPEPLELDRLGPYEILSRLGTGGMGVVYRARDSRLDRDVAIKVLPDVMANDPERIARFRREARVAASLNHPNIAAVYGFEDEGGAHFLVMELVEGATLAERLQSGAMPIDEALALGAQIAEGLEAAHENGIVHRDLKPANIKITPEGKAKILDFGLAKALDDPGTTPDIEHSQTITAHHTTPGMIFGTIPYMSPEQARGRSVDKRSDIWSLGCVLYECLSGRRAFDGESATDVLAKILERDPDWDALPPRTPPRVRELLERCLEKDLNQRARDSGDVRIELQRAQSAREWTTTGSLRIRPSRGRLRLPSALPWAVAAIAVAVAAAAWVLPRRDAPANSGEGRAPGVPLRVDVTDPEVPHTMYEDASTLAISPDGMTIAYTGSTFGTQNNNGLYLRRSDDVRARRVELACGDSPVYDPFFSPDGKWLGYSCSGLYKVSLSGGSPILLTENASFAKGATWSSRGIVYAPAAKSGLVLVREEGGPLETLTVPDSSQGEVSHRWPSALPDGRHILFTIKKEGIASFDQADIALLDLDAKSWKILVHGGSFARYLPTGQIVFTRGNSILAVSLDLRGERVVGEPVSVTSNVMTEPGSGAAHYAVAQDAGTLVFVPGGPNAARIELGWIDRKGAVTPLGAPLVPSFNQLSSPDGSRVAMTVWGATDTVAVYDTARRSLTRLPIKGNCAFADWAPDGRRILFSSDLEGGGKQALFLIDADGAGTAERVPIDFESVFIGRMFRIGNETAVIYNDKKSLWLGRLGTPGVHRLDVDLAGGIPDVSPDGRWYAYDSDVSGRREIYVTPSSEGGGNWQISRGGGDYPRWSPRGDEIIYERRPDNAYERSGGDRWTVSVHISTTNGQVAASAPIDLFKVPADTIVRRFHPDGKRFLSARELPRQFKGDRILAILNWFDQVKARTPVR
jgi:Tol biopolymer transport system component